MAALLSRTLVLATALLLALPPGWCCAAPSDPDDGPAPADGACCPCGGGHEPAPEDSAPPRRPGACCLLDSTTPPQPEGFPLLLVSFLPGVGIDLHAPHGPVAEATPASAPRSVRLHLLECVWRC